MTTAFAQLVTTFGKPLGYDKLILKKVNRKMFNTELHHYGEFFVIGHLTDLQSHAFVLLMVEIMTPHS